MDQKYAGKYTDRAIVENANFIFLAAFEPDKYRIMYKKFLGSLKDGSTTITRTDNQKLSRAEY